MTITLPESERCEYGAGSERCSEQKAFGMRDNLGLCIIHYQQARKALGMTPDVMAENPVSPPIEPESKSAPSKRKLKGIPRTEVKTGLTLTPISENDLPQRWKQSQWQEAEELITACLNRPGQWFKVQPEELFPKSKYAEWGGEVAKAKFQMDVRRLRARLQQARKTHGGAFNTATSIDPLTLCVKWIPEEGK